MIRSVNEAPVEPVAAQEERMEEANDPIPAPPADVDQPDAKRVRVDDIPIFALGETTQDIPVPPAPVGNDVAVSDASMPSNAFLQEEPILSLNDAAMNSGPAIPPTDAQYATANSAFEEAKSVPNLKDKGASSSSAPSGPSTDPKELLVPSKALAQNQAEGNIPRSFSIKGSSNASIVNPSPEIQISATDVQKGSLSIKGSSSKTNGATKPKTQFSVESGGHSEALTIDEALLPSTSANATVSVSPDIQANDKSSVNHAPSVSRQADISPKHEAADSHTPPPSTSVCVSNLVRPFTLPSLREKLEEFGEYSYFWINSVKSHCFVTVNIILFKCFESG